KVRALEIRSMRYTSNDRPPIFIKTLPGNRVDPIRAWTIATVLRPLMREVSIHVSGSRSGKHFRFAGVPKFKLDLGCEDAFLKTHHRKAVLEVSDLWNDFDSRTQLYQP